MRAVETFLAIGIGVGLASVAGVRAFLPPALASLFALFGLFYVPEQVVGIGPEILLGGLAALAVLEIVLDKVRALERGFNMAMVPVRMASGAVLFAAAMGLDVDMGSLVWLGAGAVIAGVVAVLKLVLRPALGNSAGVSGSFLSLIEDAVALVGSAAGCFVPLIPLLLVAFLLFFFYRIRKRRGRRYGGLRILGD
ncbi:MAG TPA: DUF4126 domain-containing protein [Rubrobacteraceae bacterium]|nr:DUF4126 domain-containing protein [Rubrobacteraceae bacterium]